MNRITMAIALAGTALTMAVPGRAQEAAQAPAVTGPLGLTQNAWNTYLRNRGESKKRPGYVRYVYDAQQAFPIRIREGMITSIKIPEGEEIVEAYVGDEAGFNVGLPNKSNVIVKAIYPAVDTNLIVYAESGNIYTFYLRSEAYNSKEISDFLVDVVAPGSRAAYGGAQMDAMTPQQMADFDARNPSAAAERIRDPYSTLPTATDPRYREYAEWTDFNPARVREDLGVYVPVNQVGGTIPYRVFRDDRFTYIDYGPEASQMTEWPTPLIVIQGVEGPVGNRTAGPGGRMIVIEALGDFVLRNGQRIIVVKSRTSSPDAGLVEYPTYSQTAMQVPTDLPPGRGAGLPAQPKTVVPNLAAAPTVNREHPSVVVPVTQVAKGVTPTTQTVNVVSNAVVKETPVAKGRGSAIVEAKGVVVTRTETTSSPVGITVPVATPVVVSPTVVSVVPAESRYYVSLGTGSREALENQWRSAKVQYYDLLNGHIPTYKSTGTGYELIVDGYQNAAMAIALCEAMVDQTACAVRSNK